MISKEETLKYWILSEIEKRGLEFLLSGQDRKNYRKWLKKPDDFKQAIRNMKVK